ncbi:uncharacterized protein LOC128855179 [Anastrepha ludens]|uniref:uncharacterized protein LOC128855179 n=1 Tax=Anastrepha ludens TaxID=28586 RepID=UPI0023AFDE62|nr:uncharacterized protein LOC128855179 [Anastrepha ludens]
MADCKQTFSRKGLTVDEILSLLERDDGNINNENFIYVELLIELEDQATDEDSDKSDEEHDANLNQIGCKLLRTKSELRRFHTNRGSNQDQITMYGRNQFRKHDNDNCHAVITRE